MSNEFFDMAAAPLRIRSVRLRVRDLEAVSTFYRTVLGFSQIDGSARRATLGTGDTALLELKGDPDLSPLDPRQAGLFHTAFLMPTRSDLARWVAHATAARVTLQGASDHIVSEALYLSDPEGNGIEVYADRPVSRWHGPDGEILLSTDPLDLQELLNSAAGSRWTGFPAGGSVGHVHLQVGDTAESDRFYRDILGMEIAASYPGASFYGSGGYHHQLAGNIWNIHCAGMRPEGVAGLEAVDILVRDASDLAAIAARAQGAGIEIVENAGGVTLHDPWGTRIEKRAKVGDALSPHYSPEWSWAPLALASGRLKWHAQPALMSAASGFRGLVAHDVLRTVRPRRLERRGACVQGARRRRWRPDGVGSGRRIRGSLLAGSGSAARWQPRTAPWLRRGSV